jgi:co-chaperonin GroES (HSP10)
VDVKGKKLLVVGDRVLVVPEEGEERTRVGLLLPQTAVDKLVVQSGRIVEVGPGTPVPAPAEFSEEPWKLHEQKAQYVPMEAKVGDVALFLRNAAVEIEFERRKYLIVPHAAILLLVRPQEVEGEDIDLESMLRIDRDG